MHMLASLMSRRCPGGAECWRAPAALGIVSTAGGVQIYTGRGKMMKFNASRFHDSRKSTLGCAPQRRCVNCKKTRAGEVPSRSVRKSKILGIRQVPINNSLGSYIVEF